MRQSHLAYNVQHVFASVKWAMYQEENKAFCRVLDQRPEEAVTLAVQCVRSRLD